MRSSLELRGNAVEGSGTTTILTGIFLLSTVDSHRCAHRIDYAESSHLLDVLSRM